MQSVTYFEADIPHCALTYGVPPCHAHLGFDDGENEGPFAAEFDGTSDYLTRGANLTGVVDGKAGTLSCWVDLLGGDGTNLVVFTTTNNRFQLLRVAANTYQVFGLNAANTVILNLAALGTKTSASGWCHLLASWDLATGAGQFYINDVAVTNLSVATNDTIDYTDTDFAVGATPAGTLKMNGRIGELWVNTTTRIDLSVEANRRKFIDADLRPVYLGATGEVPTGTAPAVFMSGPAANWHTNKGAGGGMTLNGELDEFAFGAHKCFNSLGTCQDRVNFDDDPVTLRFTEDIGFLPPQIGALPFIKSIDVTPAIMSLNGDLGQRATLKVTFKDTKHPDAGTMFDKYPGDRDYSDPFNRGTFWGKFRARNPFLRMRNCRIIRALIPDSFAANHPMGSPLADGVLTQQEIRHYVTDSIDGPTPKGEFAIVGKDVLKLADGDRALAPELSNGFLVAGISDSALSFTLSPAGIGNSEYPASGDVTIGGKEVVSFTRAADVMTIVRAQLNTEAVAHSTGDRVQLKLGYIGEDGADILADLWTRAGADPAFIPLAAWQAEAAAFLGVVYTLHIAEPTSISKLISEILQYMGATQWWDDVNQLIKLQILRAVSTTADRYNEDNVLDGAIEVKEQPEKRVSRVIVYFGQVNPLKKIDDLENYRSSEKKSHDQSEADEGVSNKIIFARGIAAGGRTVATTLATKYLSRYVRPPRRFNFSLMQFTAQAPSVGSGYRLGGGSPRIASWPFQDETGDRVDIPIEVTRIDPDGAIVKVEAEEMLFTAFGVDIDPTNRSIIFDANENNINLRTRHDELFPEPVSGNTVTAYINAGVIIGSTSTATPSFDVGTWPAGVNVVVEWAGRVQGKGGNGGAGGGFGAVGAPGSVGGPAFYTRKAITINYTAAADVWGGGGGGGGGAGDGGGGGGGGAGQVPGTGGPGGGAGAAGSSGTTEAGGAPGAGAFGVNGGGAGGGPALAGTEGNPTGPSGGDGGAPGAAIDGISFVTPTGSPDIRGAQIN
jgi:hypothetical protein